MERLKRKVAIITGAVAGMGKVTAERFIDEDAKVVAIDLGESNIRVNSIHLGAIETDLIKSVLSDDALDELLETIPLSKMGDPVDVAYTSLFLASDEAKYISGIEIIVERWTPNWKLNNN